MIPNAAKLTINNNVERIEQFLSEIVIAPRAALNFWSKITKQTPAAKIGYIGQHLASLITGVEGTQSGARGDDLCDGTEVKSCNKIDQVDTCKNCHHRVFKYQTQCPACGSKKIERKDDSKWLFSVRDEHELNQCLNLDRILLLLFDYPQFEENNFYNIRIASYEIYPKESRMNVFRELIRHYYFNIYKVKQKRGLKTNPMNLHPDSFQFYKCNPIRTFSCIIKNIDGADVEICIDAADYIAPEAKRNESVESVPMPSRLLKTDEWNLLIANADFENEIFPLLVSKMSQAQFNNLPIAEKQNALPLLPERLKAYIPLRDIVSITQHTQYHRS